MKLYFTPTACSLATHIVLRELGLDVELVRVDLRQKKLADGSDYLAINPKGYIPALELDDGTLLTEGVVIMQYLADTHPDAGLVPPNGTMDRVRLQEWLNFIATELHKGQSPLYNPNSSDALKDSLRERLRQRYGILAKQFENRPFIMGDRFSVADAYAFYVLTAWKRLGPSDLSETPLLHGFFERVLARKAVQEAMAVEAEAS